MITVKLQLFEKWKIVGDEMTRILFLFSTHAFLMKFELFVSFCPNNCFNQRRKAKTNQSFLLKKGINENKFWFILQLYINEIFFKVNYVTVLLGGMAFCLLL